ncbi:MAG TPA: tetraacyldisaccharide 4'-kinase [Caulifigura sp.]|nr:tetraacyldisaccharide 4'-kinase [Caulifigura sp.]
MSPEAEFLEIVSGRRQDWQARAMRAGLSCLEPIYAAASGLKNALYDCGIKRSHRAGVPVISVGNLTTGGTGKTPVVAAVVDMLVRRGLKPAIASRGYRSIDAGGNDEKRVLDLLCPGIPHLQNRDRIAAVRDLIANGAEIIVLDDGFQHRRLNRELDIVLVDATNPWGYGRQLPRGLLRESRRGLKRAGLVLMTRSDLVSPSRREQLLGEISRFTAAPIVTSRFVPHGLRDQAGVIHSGVEWKGRQVVAFCGIGNPEGFRSTLKRAGLVLHSHAVTTFADHHHYTRKDLDALIEEAQASSSAAVICTFKDLVKLPPLDVPIPILALDIGLEIIDGSTAWERAVAGYGIPRIPA